MPATDDIAYLTALVRAHDRPRYYATLFAPAALRADLFALYGFAAEIARVPDQVSEPGLGEIRLRWWQRCARRGGGRRRRRATLRRSARVAATIARHRLPLAPFEALIEARAADLYSDPPADARRPGRPDGRDGVRALPDGGDHRSARLDRRRRMPPAMPALPTASRAGSRASPPTGRAGGRSCQRTCLRGRG